jgi:hypothetical protein
MSALSLLPRLTGADLQSAKNRTRRGHRSDRAAAPAISIGVNVRVETRVVFGPR